MGGVRILRFFLVQINYPLNEDEIITLTSITSYETEILHPMIYKNH